MAKRKATPPFEWRIEVEALDGTAYSGFGRDTEEAARRLLDFVVTWYAGPSEVVTLVGPRNQVLSRQPGLNAEAPGSIEDSGFWLRHRWWVDVCNDGPGVEFGSYPDQVLSS